MDLLWDKEKSQWRGHCPRCDQGGFFAPGASVEHYNLTSIEILSCPEGHLFVVEYLKTNRSVVTSTYPKEYIADIPGWLPREFHPTYKELIYVQTNKQKRSTVAMCAILLEAHVNTQLITSGDKGKTLFEKLTVLKNKGLIDSDQFSDATITRLTRNNTFHPNEVLSEPKEEEVKEVFESVTSYLERAYIYRASRALPAGKEDKKEETLP